MYSSCTSIQCYGQRCVPRDVRRMIYLLYTAAQPHCDVKQLHGSDWTCNYRKRLSESHSLLCIWSGPLIIGMQAGPQTVTTRKRFFCSFHTNRKLHSVSKQHWSNECRQKKKLFKPLLPSSGLAKLSGFTAIWCHKGKGGRSMWLANVSGHYFSHGCQSTTDSLSYNSRQTAP